MKQKIRTNLWFDKNAVEAAEFYTSVFPDSRIVNVIDYPENSPGEAGTPMVVEFELADQSYVGINGGPEFKFSEAISLEIICSDQDEIDLYWERLTDGGEEGPCGWLKDRFGLSWQVVPEGMDRLFADPDKGKAERAMQAMLSMRKIDIAALREAAEGVTA